MQQFEDARLLIKHSREQLSRLRTLYDASLEVQNVDPTLLIEVKNLCENLRSGLDFVAKGIYLKYCPLAGGKKSYFPYAKLETDRESFKAILDKAFPGLSDLRPDLYAYFFHIQHFGAEKFKWLPIFMDLNNENKHQRLVPQLRKERKELHIKGASGRIGLVMEEGAIMDIAPGGVVEIEGAMLQGGQLVSSDHMPEIERGTAEVVKWISFSFESNNHPVLPFLSNAISGVHEIIDTFSD